MTRRLIVLCDGTGNDPSSHTNVFKFKNALARPNQVVYYDEGVGVTADGSTKGLGGRLLDFIAGGAFGSGLSANVQQGYRWLCDNYQVDDDLCFLGFSRGAYTARSIVGMVRKLGLIRAPMDGKTVRLAYDRYRDIHHPDCIETVRFRKKMNSRPVEALSLKFLGVWDTVGSLGLPVVGPRSLIAAKRWGFHDVALSSHVACARQALAADEKRAAFLPSPWRAGPASQRPPASARLDEGGFGTEHECPLGPTGRDSGRRSQDVKQVWFAGCHSDIGGKAGELAFRWMLEEAEGVGIEFNPAPASLPPPRTAQELHESLSFFYHRGIGKVVRPILEPQADVDPPEPRFLNESITPSAWRLQVTEQGATYEVPLEVRENLHWLSSRAETTRQQDSGACRGLAAVAKDPNAGRLANEHMFSVGHTDPCRPRRPWGFRGPKLGWGLFLAYYLGQYGRLSDEPRRCTCNAREWFRSLRGAGGVPMAEIAAPAVRVHRQDGGCKELEPEEALEGARSAAGPLWGSEEELWLDGRGDNVVARRGRRGERLGLVRFAGGLVTEVWMA